MTTMEQVADEVLTCIGAIHDEVVDIMKGPATVDSTAQVVERTERAMRLMVHAIRCTTNEVMLYQLRLTLCDLAAAYVSAREKFCDLVELSLQAGDETIH